MSEGTFRLTFLTKVYLNFVCLLCGYWGNYGKSHLGVGHTPSLVETRAVCNDKDNGNDGGRVTALGRCAFSRENTAEQVTRAKRRTLFQSV